MPSDISTAEPGSSALLPRAGRLLARWLRRDGLVLFLYLAATVLVTLPLALRLRGDWMPVSRDLYFKLWDVWWLETLFDTGQPWNHTRELFYPVGLDLSFAPTCWTVTATTWLLARLVGVFTAYKLMVLAAVFTTAYGAYLLVHWLTGSRLGAGLAGAVYSFAPYHLAHAREHPDVAHMAPIPLTVLLFLVGLRRGSLLAAAGGGLMLGLLAWTGLYLTGMTVMTLGLLLVWLALEGRRWRQRRFWTALGVFALCAAPLLAPRLAPILGNRDTLEDVVESKYVAESRQADLLAYVVPPGDSAFGFLTGELTEGFGKSGKQPPYLGLVALAAVVTAFLRRRGRRELWVWLGIALLFLVLSLGPSLRFNGEVYHSVRLPASLFRGSVLLSSVRPHFFHVGLLLPLAVLSGHGFSRWAGLLERRPGAARALFAGAVLLLLAEYRMGSFPMRHLRPSPFHERIAREPGEFALIDLPMDYRSSKSYLYDQTVHGRPLAVGNCGRIPSGAWRYVDAHPLLSRWRNDVPLRCEDWPEGSFEAAVDSLMAEGFRYVLTHHGDTIHLPGSIPPWFRESEPVYRDERFSAYALEDLRESPPCPAGP